MRAAILCLACLLACDSDAPTKPLESPVPEKRATTPKPAMAAPATAPAPATKDFLALLVAKPQPSLVGPFAPLTLSPLLKVPQAQRQAPYLFEKTRPNEITGSFLYTSPLYPSIQFEVDRMGQIDTGPETWLVDSLHAVMPADGVVEKLTAAWGEPTMDGKTRSWYAPELGLRANLYEDREAPADTVTLIFRGYTPLATLIGSDPTLFGFEGGAPILGATGADLTRRFGRRVMDYGKIHMWPTEIGDAVVLEFAWLLDEDELAEYVIPGYRIQLAGGDAVHALLEKKLGAPRSDREDERLKIYRKKPRITFDGAELVVGTPPEW